jgi:hypothetical protein
MGLFTRRRTRPAAVWQDDGRGVQPGAAITQNQAGASYCVRYVRDDMPGSFVIVTFCAVRLRRGQYALYRQAGWLVCSSPDDPSGVPIWIEAGYGPVDAPVYGAQEDAEWAAQDAAADALGRGCDHTWDGAPW